MQEPGCWTPGAGMEVWDLTSGRAGDRLEGRGLSWGKEADEGLAGGLRPGSESSVSLVPCGGTGPEG